MEAVLRTEKSSLNLPSHENSGRPWPLFWGHLDVLEQRKTLSEADQKTRDEIRKRPAQCGKTQKCYEHCRGQPEMGDSDRIRVWYAPSAKSFRIKDLETRLLRPNWYFIHDRDHVIPENLSLPPEMIMQCCQNALDTPKPNGTLLG